MAEYVVTASITGGSQAEAANPNLVIGPFETLVEARDYANLFFEYCATKSKTCDQDLLVVANRFRPLDDIEDVSAVAEEVFGYMWEDPDN